MAGLTLKAGIAGLALSLLASCGADGTAGGGIPFPEGYALMPGDRARWEEMNEAERRRALAYISTGSTIQSSLIAER